LEAQRKFEGEDRGGAQREIRYSGYTQKDLRQYYWRSEETVPEKIDVCGGKARLVTEVYGQPVRREAFKRTG
jgi:hypothetical protein